MLNKLSTFLGIILLISVMNINAEILSGELSGTFDSSEYIVQNDIVVSQDQMLEFKSGSVLKFEPYTGIKVFGKLKMRDATLDSKQPNGDKWNGINVSKQGEIEFDNVIIKESSFGVTVPDSSSLLRFENIQFINNYKSLQINENTVYVENGKTISIEIEDEMFVKNSSAMTIPTELNYHKGNIIKISNSVRWASLISTLAFTGVSLYYVSRSDHYVTRYNEAGESELDQIPRLRKSAEKYRSYAIGTSIGAGISVIAFSATFAF